MFEDFKKGKEFIERRVASRLEQGTDRKDFVSPILEASTKQGMTTEEMESSLEIIVIAGSLTTSTLLNGALFHLLTHESTLQKLLT